MDWGRVTCRKFHNAVSGKGRPAAASPPRARVARPIGSVFQKRPGKQAFRSVFGKTDPAGLCSYSKKTAPSYVMLEAVIFLIAVPLKLTEKSTRFMYYHTRRMDNGSGSRRRLLLVRSQPRKSIPQMLPCCDHTARSSLKCSLSEYSSFSSVSLCFLYCTSLQSKSQSPV